MYAEKIYRGVHRSSIDTLTAFQLMGFAGKSGASATALGSIRQFGLIEGTGDSTRISELALRILEPASPLERNEAVLESARKPDVFKSIFERFDGRIPATDEPIRAFLIRELGFSQTGVNECLTSLRATLAVVVDITAEIVPASRDEIAHAGQPRLDTFDAGQGSESNEPVQSFRIPLTRDCAVELRFSGPITERALGNLIRQIELTKEVWAEE